MNALTQISTSLLKVTLKSGHIFNSFATFQLAKILPSAHNTYVHQPQVHSLVLVLNFNRAKVSCIFTIVKCKQVKVGQSSSQRGYQTDLHKKVQVYM